MRQYAKRVAALALFAGAPSAAAQDIAAQIGDHQSKEARLVAQANGASAQALDLRLKGKLAESVPLYRRAVQAYEAIVASCGRVEGQVVYGCAYDESTLGSAVVDLAGALHDLGKTDEGLRAFAEVTARLEARWQGCGTAAWDFTCAEAAEKRRWYLNHNARFLELAGRIDGALAIRRRILGEHEALLGACTGEACKQAVDDAFSAYLSVRETLGRASRDGERLALDELWLPRLATAPRYAASKQAGAGRDEKEFAENVDGLVAQVAALGTPPARALVARLGRPDQLATQDASAALTTRLKKLDAEYLALSGRRPERKPEIRAEQVKLIAAAAPRSRQHGEALGQLGSELWLADRPADAAEAHREALKIHRANEEADDFRVLMTAEQLARMLVRAGKPQAAIAALSEVLADPKTDRMDLYTDPARRAATAYGVTDRNSTLNRVKALHAELLLAHGGDPALALSAARHAATGVAAYRASLGASMDDERSRENAEQSPELYTGESRFGAFSSLYADALWAAGQRDGASRDAAFAALQEATGGVTTSALAKSAAARIASVSGAGPLLDKRAALTRQIANLARASLETSGGKASTDIFYSQARLNDERSQLDARIAAAAPDYFALTRPQPLTPQEASQLLGPDEAALVAVPAQFGTHMLLVTREGVAWYRAELPEARLNNHVRRLLWDVGANVEVNDEEKARWEKEGQGAFPFDRGTAHLLYRELVAPFADRLGGKRHLFVIGRGALGSLPFSMLVAEMPEGADGDPEALRRTAWFGDRYALVQLPSLQSLKLLRLVAARGAQAPGQGLLGYGDPVLDGLAQTRGTGGGRRRTRAPAVPPAASLVTSAGDTKLADVALLRQLARLPGTVEELQAMRGAFPAGTARIRLAAEATEARLKSDNLAGLSVLAFATHGLLAGEATQVGGSEPGLVLTPPASATARDDGLLTASEVAGLRIGADWVVLSACNTAAGDGSSGAAGLSGLARAFFFAGARSLLASHWPVRDDVAALLTVEALKQKQAHAGWSRAEALRAAMKSIRDDPRADADGDSWAHPSAWAPFTYIGDWHR
jgi:CHAT domain-containing protein